MLYYLLYPLHDINPIFNIFRYITFRAAMAMATAFALSVIFGPAIIRMLSRMKIGENIRKEDSAKLYDLSAKKQDTPTMGGIFILLAIVVSTLLWAQFNKYVLLALFATIWLGLTGFTDDYLKHVRKCSKGLTASAKFTSQIILGLILGVMLMVSFGDQGVTKIDLPFFKDISFDLGVFYVLFVILVITGSSNAVNLTDGLDGLAIGNVIIVAFTFSILSYISGNIKISHYLLLPYLADSSELAIFCAGILGAGLGFLWFNAYPASIFMGDVGSLALGGAIGTVALLIKKELLLVIVGGVFVLEALSVILQVFSFRVFKRRIFKIAPLHHHFQFLGWSENKVIIRFWIIAILFALLTLVTLKTR